MDKLKQGYNLNILMLIFLRKTSKTSINTRKKKKKKLLAWHDIHLEVLDTDALRN